MTSRRTRIQKIVKLRERELEQSAARLAAAHLALAAASEQVELEAARKLDAEAERAALGSSAADADRWREVHGWVALRASYHDAAVSHLENARLAAARAQHELLAARTALKQLEVLDERLDRWERRAESRRENKLHDELAATRHSHER